MTWAQDSARDERVRDNRRCGARYVTHCWFGGFSGRRRNARVQWSASPATRLHNTPHAANRTRNARLSHCRQSRRRRCRPADRGQTPCTRPTSSPALHSWRIPVLHQILTLAQIEFPSILLPPDISSGSIVDIDVARNIKAESDAATAFYELQSDIFRTFGQSTPTVRRLPWSSNGTRLMSLRLNCVALRCTVMATRQARSPSLVRFKAPN
jgi:hypothetical protein